MTAPERYAVGFPTLWVGPAWVEAHCIQPDGFHRGRPFRYYDWQLWCTANHYRVRPEAEWQPDNPLRAAAFTYRRSVVIGPQKTGKGPWSATGVALEGAGPALFRGWAGRGDGYACSDHGCGCGWEYEYDPGEPMGMRWPTPLIQITATSEDQTANIYRPLQDMIRLGPLGDLMRVGEGFIRIGLEGRIDVVTSNAQSRLGNPVTYVPQDETGLYNDRNGMRKVAETQRRGLAGMSGRSQETTNPYDPSEDSVAQRSFESQAEDVFKFYEPPPANLSYRNKRERRKIHQINYAGSPHVDVDAIDAEAAELAEKDPEQAERFFGNRMVYGAGSWMDGDSWDARAWTRATRSAEVAAIIGPVGPRTVPAGTPVVLGFDGSDTDDWTVLRAQTEDGYQFTPTYGPDRRPCIWDPAQHGGQVPRLEVRAAFAEITKTFKVVRAYLDPPGWKSEIDELAEEHGEKVFLRWETYRLTQMHAAAVRLHTDVVKSDTNFTHDGDEVIAVHMRNARKLARAAQRYVLGKPSQTQKIDGAISSILCNEAAGDVTAAGAWPKPVDDLIYTASTTGRLSRR
jgi:hypothetical protein